MEFPIEASGWLSWVHTGLTLGKSGFVFMGVRCACSSDGLWVRPFMLLGLPVPVPSQDEIRGCVRKGIRCKTLC